MAAAVKMFDVSTTYGPHPARYAIEGLTEAVLAHGADRITPQRQLGRILNKVGLAMRRQNGPFVVVPLMGTKFPPAFSASIRGRLVLFCWDMWASNWDLWETKLRQLRPALVVATSVVSRDEMRRRLPHLRIEHLPEATRTQDHDASMLLHERSIDVLELGRRHTKWHDAFRAAQPEPGLVHLFERVKGQIIFPDKAALQSGLAQSRIAICFPASTTDPQKAGPVCTMTHRYLECILSGCLVLGECPPELREILGYDPVIPVNWARPAEQVADLLSNISDYQQHVNTARQDLLGKVDWNTRAAELMSLISSL